MTADPRTQTGPRGRTARLVERDGVVVASSQTTIDDDVFRLIDAGRT